VFVQSLRTGSPLRASPWMSSQNGLTLLSAERMPKGTRVPEPEVVRAEAHAGAVLRPPRRGSLVLPIDRNDRELDLSRFDVGGVSNALAGGQALRLPLFQIRGVYRPGDAFHVGVIVKPADWTTPLAGIPSRRWSPMPGA